MSPLRLLALAATLFVALLTAAAPASARDRNHDRIPDRWEKRHHLSLKVNQARRDQDHDGLRNRGEFRAGLNPRKPDSDRDGIEDGDENAGTITSFADGVLTIALAGGGELSGGVDDRTEIECPPAAPTARASHDGDDEDDDSSGPGSGDRDDDDHSGPGRGGDDDDDHGDDDDGTPDQGGGNDDDDDQPTGGDDDGTPDQGGGNDDEGDDDDDASCGTDALVAGTRVREAELKLTSAGRFFREVELGRPAA
ncbi:MAG TPA: hypothetical protein VF533_11080 [Solirubrobacteraceae bacterium]